MAAAPSPAQVDAMREWLSRTYGDVSLAEFTDGQILNGIARHYPGGVEQFLANHKERGS